MDLKDTILFLSKMCFNLILTIKASDNFPIISFINFHLTFISDRPFMVLLLGIMKSKDLMCYNCNVLRRFKVKTQEVLIMPLRKEPINEGGTHKW